MYGFISAAGARVEGEDRGETGGLCLTTTTHKLTVSGLSQVFQLIQGAKLHCTSTVLYNLL